MGINATTLITGGAGTAADPFTGWEAGANAALAQGRAVEFGAGGYQYSASLDTWGSGAALVGESRGSVRFSPSSGFFGPLIDVNTSANTLLFRDFLLAGDGAGDGRIGIHLRGYSSRHTMERVEVDAIGRGVVGDYSWVNSLRDCVIAACGVGVDLEAQCNAWSIMGGSLQHATTAALRADHGEVLNIGGGCNVAENMLDGLVVGPYYEGVNIDGAYFENNIRRNITLNGTEGGRVEGNRFGAVLGTNLSNADAALMADVMVFGSSGVRIGGNSHEGFIDIRQQTHILFADFMAANTKCSLTGGANVISKRFISASAGDNLPDFWFDGTSNKDPQAANGGSFDEYKSGSLSTSQALVFNTVLDNGLAYDIYVTRMVSANNGDIGKYTVGTVGTSDLVAGESPIGSISVYLNSSRQVVVRNDGGTAFIRATLTQRMPS